MARTQIGSNTDAESDIESTSFDDTFDDIKAVVNDFQARAHFTSPSYLLSISPTAEDFIERASEYVTRDPRSLNVLLNTSFLDIASVIISDFTHPQIRLEAVENSAGKLMYVLQKLISQDKEHILQVTSNNTVDSVITLLEQKHISDIQYCHPLGSKQVLSQMVVQSIDFLATIVTWTSAVHFINKRHVYDVITHFINMADTSSIDTRFWVSAYYLLSKMSRNLPGCLAIIPRDHIAIILNQVNSQDVKRMQILDIIIELISLHKTYQICIQLDLPMSVINIFNNYATSRELTQICEIMATICQNGDIAFMHLEELHNVSMNKLLCAEQRQTIDCCLRYTYNKVASMEALCKHIRRCQSTSMADFQCCDNCDIIDKLIALIHRNIGSESGTEFICSILSKCHPKLRRGILNARKAGKTALFVATEKQQTELCSLFLEKYGVPAEQLCSASFRWGGTLSCLGMAVLLKDKNAIDVFCRHKAILNPTPSYVDVPLHLACYSGDLDIVKHIIMKGSFPHGRGRMGMTPLMYAYQYPNICRYLIDKNADVNAVSHEGLTALTLAVRNDMVETASLLLEHGAINTGTVSGLLKIQVEAALYESHGVLAVLLETFKPQSTERFKILLLSSASFLCAKSSLGIESEYGLMEQADVKNAFKNAVQVHQENNLPPCVIENDMLWTKIKGKSLLELVDILDDNNAFPEHIHWVLCYVLGRHNTYTLQYQVFWLRELCMTYLPEEKRRIVLLCKKTFTSETMIHVELEHILTCLDFALLYIITQLLEDDKTDTIFELVTVSLGYVKQVLEKFGICTSSVRPHTKLIDKYRNRILNSITGIVHEYSCFDAEEFTSSQNKTFLNTLREMIEWNPKDENGNSLLQILLQRYIDNVDDDMEVDVVFEREVDLFIQAGADVNETNMFGQTPIHLLRTMKFSFEDNMIDTLENVVEKLLHAGADIDLREKQDPYESCAEALLEIEPFCDPEKLSRLKFENRSLQLWAACTIREYETKLPYMQLLPDLMVDYVDKY